VIEELQDEPQQGTNFSKIDVKSGYWHIALSDGLHGSGYVQVGLGDFWFNQLWFNQLMFGLIKLCHAKKKQLYRKFQIEYNLI